MITTSSATSDVLRRDLHEIEDEDEEVVFEHRYLIARDDADRIMQRRRRILREQEVAGKNKDNEDKTKKAGEERALFETNNKMLESNVEVNVIKTANTRNLAQHQLDLSATTTPPPVDLGPQL